MAQAVPDSKEFWRPPSLAQALPAVAMTTACVGCGIEFMVEAAYCHLCGKSREIQPISPHQSSLDRYVGVLRALEFQNVKDALGLGTASLIAFVVGLGCVAAALFVGWFNPMQNLTDFQAVQIWRIEWLLAAVVAFLAALVLRHSAELR